MNCLPCFKKKDSEEKKTDENKSDEEVPVAQPKEDPLSKQPSGLCYFQNCYIFITLLFG